MDKQEGELTYLLRIVYVWFSFNDRITEATIVINMYVKILIDVSTYF